MRALVAHGWPGNVRELQNLIERAVTLASPGEELDLAELPDGTVVDEREGALADIDPTRPFHEAKERAVEAFERAYLKAILQRHDGNISHAAREAGIDRKTIHRLLRKYGIRIQLERLVAMPD